MVLFHKDSHAQLAIPKLLVSLDLSNRDKTAILDLNKTMETTKILETLETLETLEILDLVMSLSVLEAP